MSQVASPHLKLLRRPGWGSSSQIPPLPLPVTSLPKLVFLWAMRGMKCHSLLSPLQLAATCVMLKNTTARDNDKKSPRKSPSAATDHRKHLIPTNPSLCFRDFLLWALGQLLERWWGETGAAGLVLFHKVSMEILYTWQDFKESYRPVAGHNSTYHWEGEEWCIAFFCLKWMLRKACKQALFGCLQEHRSAGLSSAGPYVQVSSAFLVNERWTEAYGFLVLPKWNRETASFWKN